MGGEEREIKVLGDKFRELSDEVKINYNDW